VHPPPQAFDFNKFALEVAGALRAAYPSAGAFGAIHGPTVRDRLEAVAAAEAAAEAAAVAPPGSLRPINPNRPLPPAPGGPADPPETPPRRRPAATPGGRELSFDASARGRRLLRAYSRGLEDGARPEADAAAARRRMVTSATFARDLADRPALVARALGASRVPAGWIDAAALAQAIAAASQASGLADPIAGQCSEILARRLIARWDSSGPLEADGRLGPGDLHRLMASAVDPVVVRLAALARTVRAPAAPGPHPDRDESEWEDQGDRDRRTLAEAEAASDGGNGGLDSGEGDEGPPRELGRALPAGGHHAQGAAPHIFRRPAPPPPRRLPPLNREGTSSAMAYATVVPPCREGTVRSRRARAARTFRECQAARAARAAFDARVLAARLGEHVAVAAALGGSEADKEGEAPLGGPSPPVAVELVVVDPGGGRRAAPARIWASIRATGPAPPCPLACLAGLEACRGAAAASGRLTATEIRAALAAGGLGLTATEALRLCAAEGGGTLGMDGICWRSLCGRALAARGGRGWGGTAEPTPESSWAASASGLSSSLPLSSPPPNACLLAERASVDAAAALARTARAARAWAARTTGPADNREAVAARAFPFLPPASGSSGGLQPPPHPLLDGPALVALAAPADAARGRLLRVFVALDKADRGPPGSLSIADLAAGVAAAGLSDARDRALAAVGWTEKDSESDEEGRDSDRGGPVPAPLSRRGAWTAALAAAFPFSPGGGGSGGFERGADRPSLADWALGRSRLVDYRALASSLCPTRAAAAAERAALGLAPFGTGRDLRRLGAAQTEKWADDAGARASAEADAAHFALSALSAALWAPYLAFGRALRAEAKELDSIHAAAEGEEAPDADADGVAPRAGERPLGAAAIVRAARAALRVDLDADAARGGAAALAGMTPLQIETLVHASIDALGKQAPFKIDLVALPAEGATRGLGGGGGGGGAGGGSRPGWCPIR